MPYRRTVVSALVLLVACSSRDDGRVRVESGGEVVPPTVADSVGRLLALAGEAEAAGDSAGARDHLAAAVALDGRDAAILLRVARADDALGNRGAAIAEYRRFLALHPSGVVAMEARRRIAALGGAGAARASRGLVGERAAVRPAEAAPVAGDSAAVAPAATAATSAPLLRRAEGAGDSAAGAASESARAAHDRRRAARDSAAGAVASREASPEAVAPAGGVGSSELRRTNDAIRRADSVRRADALRVADSLRRNADSLRRVADSLRGPDSLRAKPRGATRDSVRPDTTRHGRP